MARPDRPETKNDRQDDVRRGAEPITFHGQVQGLQAERGKRGVTAANAGHESQPPFRPNEQSAFRSGVSRKKTDYEATAHVHEQGPVGKRFAKAPADYAGEPVAGDAPQRAAAGDEPVIKPMHSRCLSEASAKFNTRVARKRREE